MSSWRSCSRCGFAQFEVLGEATISLSEHVGGLFRLFAPQDVPVVMSSIAWEDYSVPGAPYFVLVDGEVRGEGVATTWQALASLVTDAIEDERTTPGIRRGRAVDETLAAGGIGPDHPSLHPGP